ncbi:hypothetical protein BaRGS_00039475, partial [Batillaria attramentaria]
SLRVRHNPKSQFQSFSPCDGRLILSERAKFDMGGELWRARAEPRRKRDNSRVDGIWDFTPFSLIFECFSPLVRVHLHC